MIDVLTSLRFVAILLIYFHHLSYPGGLGPAAVTFFFVLSGFIMHMVLGGLSFTFYMLHQIVITYTAVFFMSSIFLFIPDFKHLMSQFLLFVSIVLLSDVTFRYFETPVRKKILSRLEYN